MLIREDEGEEEDEDEEHLEAEEETDEEEETEEAMIGTSQGSPASTAVERDTRLLLARVRRSLEEIDEMTRKGTVKTGTRKPLQ